MIKTKIKKAEILADIIAKLKKQGKKIVFTNGCFDILHFAHVKYLEEARGKGDILIVGVNSTSSIKRIKGNLRPIISEHGRAGVIAALESVDFVTVFNESTPLNLIKKLKPDILIKGADWKTGSIVGAEVIKKYGGKVLRAKFLKGYSTSKIIEKIVKKNIL
ncbi:MAG: D-glycero-beta-D-manno-heptose 1-phosphate adenylyltransferase [Candidatus Omnitrophica bacterium]|nr:D-glycero-beta-D-manno-heptose 1-phosphate adenylyltransferase [Candidatus Omnitrophota bacterium]